MNQETRWLTRYNEDTYGSWFMVNGSWFLDEPSDKVDYMVMTDTTMIDRLKQFVESEMRSCSMDIGGITPLYVYRMWEEQ